MDTGKQIKEDNLPDDQKKRMEQAVELISSVFSNSEKHPTGNSAETTAFLNVLRNLLPEKSEASSSKSPKKQQTLDKWFVKNKSQVTKSPDETINSTTQEFRQESNPNVVCESLETSQTKSESSTSKIIDTVECEDDLCETARSKVLLDKEIIAKNGMKHAIIILTKIDSETPVQVSGVCIESISKCHKKVAEDPNNHITSNTTNDVIPLSPKLIPKSVLTEKSYKTSETAKPASKKSQMTLGVNEMSDKANVNTGATKLGDEKPKVVEKLNKKSKPTRNSNKKLKSNLKLNDLSKANGNSNTGCEAIEGTDKLLIVTKPVSKTMKCKPVIEHSKLRVETDAVSVVSSDESDTQKSKVFNKMSEIKETDKLLVVVNSKVKKNKKPLQRAKLVVGHSKLMAADALEISEIEPVLPDKDLASIKLSQITEKPNDDSGTVKKIDESISTTKSTSKKSLQSTRLDEATLDITKIDGALPAEHQNDKTQINEKSSAASRTIEKIEKSVTKSTSKKSKKSPSLSSKIVTEHSRNIDVASSEITEMDGVLQTEHQNDKTPSLNESSQVNEKSSEASRTIEEADKCVIKSTSTEKGKKYEAFCKLNETLKTLGIKTEDFFKNKKTTKYIKSGCNTDDFIVIQGHKFKSGLTKHSAYSVSKAELEKILDK